MEKLNEGIYRALKAQCWPGRRIVCVAMIGEPRFDGEKGTVRYCDEYGNIHVSWDCGARPSPCIYALMDQWAFEDELRHEEGAGAQGHDPRIVLL